MNSNEWPLVFFTVLAQLSAGILSIGLAFTALMRQQPGTADELRRHVFLAALVLAILALIISFLHLSRPVNALFASSNIQDSWLSREIILLSLYVVLLGVCFLTTRIELPGHLLRGPLYALTAIAGILLIFSMVRLYMIPTVPAWNHAGTPVAFFNTALLAGSAALLAGLIFFSSRGMDWQSLLGMARVLTIIAIAGIAINILTTSLLIPTDINPAAAFMAKAIPAAWKVTQVFFLLTAFACLVAWLVLSKNELTPAIKLMVYYAALAVLIAEVCGRYIFYASYYRVGV